MEQQGVLPNGLTRRSFIKGAAAVAGAAAVSGAALSACTPQAQQTPAASGAPKTSLFAGVCRGNCAGGCFLNIHVRDNKVVRTTARDLPNTEYNRICARGITQPARVYSAERLQYPLRRVGERGTGSFERISWDEAINEIAEKWGGYTKQYGPSSLGIMMGTGNYAICGGTTIASACQRFQNVIGAAEVPLNVDEANRFSAMLGTSMYGSENEPTDFKNSKTFVIWGSNPSVSQPQVMHFILEAQEKGTRLIVIDPVYNTNASKADWYIPVNPASDGALAMGILVELFANGWQDKAFLKASTEAPFLIKADGLFAKMSDFGVKPTEGDVDPATGKPAVIDPHAVYDAAAGKIKPATEASDPALEGVPAEVEGVAVSTVYSVMLAEIAKWTVERASELSGVPANDIRELARVYAQDGPVNTYAMFGDDHYNNGPYNYGPIYSLVLATGNAGKPGAGAGLVTIIPINVANFAGALFPVDAKGTPAQGGAPGLLINQLPTIIEKETFAGEPYTLKSIYVTNSNPAATMAERQKTLYWLKNIEFLVVADMVMTETAKYADILLPVCHWFETTDLFTSYGTHPHILWQEKAIEPQFESKCDWDIYRAITKAMGLGDYFDMEPEGFIETWIDSDGAKALGITYDKLKQEKAARILPGDVWVSFEGGVFGTPSGRGRFYQETIVPTYDIGQTIDESKERTFLYWEPALEADINSPVRGEFPFSVLSDHMRTRTHSQWWDVGYVKEYEPDPVVRMNPEDAAELGIKEGDTVRMHNKRGEVTLRATVNNGLPRKMVSCPRSFQEGEFIAGHYSDISFNAFNQCVANQAFNDVAVAIEKA